MRDIPFRSCLNRSGRFRAALVLLSVLAAMAQSPREAGAVQVNLPTGSIIADGSSNRLNVSLSDIAGQIVVGYDFFFTITPRDAAQGALSLSGDFAVAPLEGQVFGPANPSQSLLGTGSYYAGYALTAGEVTLDPGLPNLLALDVVAPLGTVGTFDLVFSPGSVLYADDDLNPVPLTGFANGVITVTAVPEPATALALSGLASHLACRRRRASPHKLC